MSAGRRPSPQKKNTPADVGASRGQVSSEGLSTGRNVAANDNTSNPLRAVASGALSAAGRTFDVDVLSNGEHVFRFNSVSSVFGVAPDHRHFGRTIERISSVSNGKALRPIEFVEASGGGRANGITSAQFVALLREFIQRGMDGKLKGKQAQALAGAWAVASALMAEGVDSMIDAALGIARTPEEALERAAAHFERELGEAKAQLDGEKKASAFLAQQLEASAARVGELAKKNEKLEARVRELEELAKRDGTVGEEWAREHVTTMLAYIASIAAEANGKSKSSNRRKIETIVRYDVGFVKRGSGWKNYPATPEKVSQLKVAIDAELSKQLDALREARAARESGAQLSITIVVTFGGAP